MTELNETVNNWTFALFDLARETDQLLSQISNESVQILKIIKQNKDYLKILNSFDLSMEQKNQLIDEAFSSYHPYLLNTIKLATKKHAIKYLDGILHRFIELSNDKLNIKFGYVYSTKKLTAKEITKLQNKLSSQLKSKVVLVNEIDQKLIGGIKIKVDEFLIDNSVLGKLNNIKKSIEL
ncbi:F0F1 ATP synthase subunit delta [Metamycoplasma alkalescens]|uniref:ATP synthase subunit delta n=1 Tax=Metamycoplasma alkalescens 14918 TaxID=1188234 RepID=N9SQC5_9BACT|nr:F0F1 ATP synthase subunit delta [Metamycoplasma alkalescens]ENY53675.1 ATP synthase delta chain [Metamycoplasma alkalescens 14918]